MPKEFRLPPFDLRLAMDTLASRDPRLAPLIASAPEFRIEVETAGADTPYEVLLESIAYQSISGKAAETIFNRVKALGTNGHAPTPEQMLKIPVRKLRKAGLSGAKVLAMKDLAKKTLQGVVPSRAEAETLSDDQLVSRLISVRGVGAWTVEMFLIFRLGRPDVLPIHDLGVQKGFALAYNKRHIPKPKDLLKFGERWRPYRTVATWYLWRAVNQNPAQARKITPAPAKKPRPKRKNSRKRP
jgi:3-methyladenine DNA glycosylase/8-oxoguanine DNA glycosylase